MHTLYIYIIIYIFRFYPIGYWYSSFMLGIISLNLEGVSRVCKDMWVKVCYTRYYESVVSVFQYIYTNCRSYRGLSGIEVYKDILMFLFFPLYICINLSQFYNSSICSKVSTYSLSTTTMMINIPLKYVKINSLACLEF